MNSNASQTQRKLDVVQVGIGYFGSFQLNAWLRLEAACIRAIVETDEERRQSAAANFSGLEFYPDITTVLDRSVPDIIDLATPPASHKTLLDQVLGKIKTVICQKPFCTNIDEAREMVQVAEDSNTTLIIHENFRFMPWYRIIKRLIEQNELGALARATFRFRPGDGNGPDAYLERQPYFQKMPKFLVHETGIHWVDVFRYLFGEPNSLYADLWRANPVIAGEDSGILLFEFENAMRAVFDGTRLLDHAADNHRLTMGEMLIEGSKATLKLNGDGHIHLRRFGEKNWSPVPYSFKNIDFGGDCVFHFQQHVLSHLLDGTPIETLAKDYLNNLEIEELAYRSHQEGRRLHLH